ncbi:phage tail protein [Psychrobacter sp. KCTC 72983]|uniref:phage tail-collar fiber domain-containing protein n=1 Tax=Psychrobacter sp. KCTC 72983 TaxID=2733866 RepID=UPI001646CF6D|nr:phage tail protein [Psychrobacter sp. KCTC 72983]
MSYQLLLTTIGKQKIAAAANTGSVSLSITEFVIGQGIDVDFSQRLDEQVLVSKRYQGLVGSVTPTTVSGQYEIVCIVPPNQGGWTIRELGLIDSDGDLIWVGQLPEVQKPAANSTAAVDYRIKAVISIDNPDVSLVIDANVVTATRQWSSDTFVPLSHLDDANPHTQYTLKETNDKDIKELQDWIEILFNLKPIKVGDIYTTTIDHADAAAVALHHGYGDWERYAEGRTLVGLSTSADDPDSYKTIGNEFGENKHTLTIEQIPSHAHDLGISARTRVSHDDSQETDRPVDATGEKDSGYVGNTGGGEAHNNIQPSKVVAHWLRTA